MKFNELRVQDAATKTYLGSPSILRLDNGEILATHDYFGRGCPRNHENEEFLTSVYRSDDDGKTWRNVGHIAGQYWSNLFKLDGSVYIFGVSQQYGSIVIRRSQDSGMTWTYPVDSRSGLLFKGGYYHDPPNYHCAPVPILIHEGRLYRAFEDCDPCVWGSGFKSLVVSAPVNSDLLAADNWTMSNKLAFDPRWIPTHWPQPAKSGWLEGNVVLSPEGEIFNILRLSIKPGFGKAAVIKVLDHGARIIFDPDSGFIDFPGGMTKFTIRRDPVSGLYLSLVNNVTDPPGFCEQRNVLSLTVSRDLMNWRHVKTLIEDDQGLSWEESVKLTGFQYVDWRFDGEDIIYLVRTGYDGAHNFHDANRITFHVLEDYGDLLSPFLV